MKIIILGCIACFLFPTLRGQLVISPAQVRPGGTVTVSGTMPLGEPRVRILWDSGEIASTLCEGGVNETTGQFSLDVVVPIEAAPGVNYQFHALPAGGDLDSLQSGSLGILSPPGLPLTGVLLQPSGSPVANATITLLAENGSTAGTSITNNAGQFSFPEVQPGFYNLAGLSASGGVSLGNPFPFTPENSIAELTTDLSVPYFNGAVKGAGMLVVPALTPSIDPEFANFPFPVSSESNPVFARLAKLPETVETIVFYRIWANVEFLGNGNEEVEFALHDEAGTLIWSVNTTSPGLVSNSGFGHFTAWNVLISSATLRPGKLTLSITPSLNGNPGATAKRTIVVEDFRDRWFGSHLSGQNLKIRGSKSLTPGISYSFGADSGSPGLPWNEPITIPIVDKVLENSAYLGVTGIRETALFRPDIVRIVSDRAPKFEASVTILDQDLLSRSFTLQPVLNGAGSLTTYRMPRQTVYGPKTILEIPLYNNGPGIASLDVCPGPWDAEISAGWRVYIYFKVTGRLELENTLQEDLSFKARAIPVAGGTIGGYVRIELVLCHANAHASGTLEAQFPIAYTSVPSSIGFESPCITLQGRAGADIGCLGLGFGAGGSIGPYTLLPSGGKKTAPNSPPPAGKAQSSPPPFAIDPVADIAHSPANYALSIWVQDEATTAGNPKPFLYYSSYEPGTKTWNSPARVFSQEAIVSDPQVVFLDDNLALAVWKQNQVTPSQARSGTVPELGYYDLWYAIWEDGVWGAPAAIMQDLLSDGPPKLTVRNGVAGLVWSKNLAPAGQVPLLGIVYASFTGNNGWDPPETVFATPNEVQMQAALDFDTDGNPRIVWCRDHDGDLTTYGDRAIWHIRRLASGWQTPEFVSDAPGCFAPVISVINDNRSIIAYLTPPSVDGELTNGLSNRNLIHLARPDQGSWLNQLAFPDIYAEQPQIHATATGEVTLTFRGFAETGDDSPLYQHGDLLSAVLRVDGEEGLDTNATALTSDGRTNWKCAADFNPTTGEFFFVTIKQDPLDGTFEPASFDGTMNRTSTDLLYSMAPGGPALALMREVRQVDLKTSSEDLEASITFLSSSIRHDISAKITNVGFAPSSTSGFAVQLLNAANGQVLRSAFIGEILDLEESTEVTFTYLDSSGQILEFEVRVDPANAVVEKDENNNSGFLTSAPLLPPNTLSAVLDPSTGGVRLSWLPDDTHANLEGLYYLVYRKDLSFPDEPSAFVGYTVGLTFLDPVVPAGSTQEYTVTAGIEDDLFSLPSIPERVIVPNEHATFPFLQQEIEGDFVFLRWPVGARGWVLQGSDELITWETISTTPLLRSESHLVPVRRTKAKQFYRLVRFCPAEP